MAALPWFYACPMVGEPDSRVWELFRDVFLGFETGNTVMVVGALIWLPIYTAVFLPIATFVGWLLQFFVQPVVAGISPPSSPQPEKPLS